MGGEPLRNRTPHEVVECAELRPGCTRGHDGVVATTCRPMCAREREASTCTEVVVERTHAPLIAIHIARRDESSATSSSCIDAKRLSGSGASARRSTARTRLGT